MSLTNTSRKAYLNEVAPTLGARQIAVCEVFEHAGERDFTNSELSEELGWTINRVTPRVKELRQYGILTLARERQCRITGRRVKAWKMTDTAPVKPKTLPQEPEFFQRPSHSKRGETHTVKQIGGKVVCDCAGFYYRQTCRHVKQMEIPMNTQPNLF